jgi:hypothetical protein
MLQFPGHSTIMLILSMNQIRRIVKAVHIPLHLMKPVRPKEVVMCLCAKCLGYDIQKKIVVGSKNGDATQRGLPGTNEGASG